MQIIDTYLVVSSMLLLAVNTQEALHGVTVRTGLMSATEGQVADVARGHVGIE